MEELCWTVLYTYCLQYVFPLTNNVLQVQCSSSESKMSKEQMWEKVLEILPCGVCDFIFASDNTCRLWHKAMCKFFKPAGVLLKIFVNNWIDALSDQYFIPFPIHFLHERTRDKRLKIKLKLAGAGFCPLATIISANNIIRMYLLGIAFHPNSLHSGRAYVDASADERR